MTEGTADLQTTRLSQESLDRRLAKTYLLLRRIDEITERGQPSSVRAVRRRRLEKLLLDLLSLGAKPGHVGSAWPKIDEEARFIAWSSQPEWKKRLDEDESGWRTTELRTPPWVEAHCRDHEHGWFVPFVLSAEHPVVGGGCLECEELFGAGDEVVALPLHDARGSRWGHLHRICVERHLRASGLVRTTS